MPCWIALPIRERDGAHRDTLVAQAQVFTPKVTLDLPEAVLLEVKASRRLFGGESALLARVRGALAGHVDAAGLGRTARAAWAALRTRPRSVPRAEPGDAAPWQWHGQWRSEGWQWLEALPVGAVPELQPHTRLLSTLGVGTLGQLRALPRAGLTQRLGGPALRALDQAFGLQPEHFGWVGLPESFQQGCQWGGRLALVDELMQQALPLLEALCDWLAARQAGVRVFRLRWQFDGPRSAAPFGEVTVQLAQASRELRRLQVMLAEQMRTIDLPWPVEALELVSLDVQRLAPDTRSLFQQEGAPGAADWLAPEELGTPAGQREQARRWGTLLERLSARLGADRVRQGAVCADHRPEWAQRWWSVMAETVRGGGGAAPSAARSAPSGDAAAALPLPTWLLAAPAPLAWHGVGHRARPAWQGPLQWLSGPHRVEAGWWDAAAVAPVWRDYCVASNPQGDLLWVYRDRGLTGDSPLPRWFLHGFYA